MEDFTALAGSLSGSVGDARGVLILSRDGLLLGAYPTDAESQLKTAWLHFASLGEPERGFVQFGTEIWSYVRRGAYAAFVVSTTSVRPGLVLDQIEMVLLAAEESRSRREGVRVEPSATPTPPAPAAPSSKPRTPLHPETRPVVPPPAVIRAETPPAVSVNVTPAPASAADAEPRDFAGTPGPAGDNAPRREPPAIVPPGSWRPTNVVPPTSERPTPGEPPSPNRPAGAAPTPAMPVAAGSAASATPAAVVPEKTPTSPQPPVKQDPTAGTRAPEQPVPEAPTTPPRGAPGSNVWGRSDDGNDEEGSEEVDRFSLAREFSQLLQEDSDGADG